MPRTMRRDEYFTDAGASLLTLNGEEELALDDLEALIVGRMDVFRGTRVAGAEDDHAPLELAIGLARRDKPEDPFAGDGLRVKRGDASAE